MPEPPSNDDDRMGKVLTISLHPYKPLIAIGCHNSTIKLWSLKAKTFVTSVTHPGRIQAVAFSQCGKYLASAGSLVEDGNAVYTIFIWDITFDHNAQPVLVYYDQELSPDTLELLHQGDITSLCFQPTILEGQNCTILASGSHDQTVRLWDFKRMKRLILRQHKAEVTCVSYTDDARFLASGSSDCSVMLWRFIYVPANYNASSGPPTTTPNADCYPFVTQVAHFNAGVNEMVRSLSFFPSYQDIGAITREYVLSVGTSMSVQILRIHDLNIKEDPKMEMLDFFTKIKQYEVMREHLLQQLAAGKRPVELDPNRRINYIHINILSRIPIHDVQTVHASYHETARRDRRIDMMERERNNSTPPPDDDKRSKRAGKRAKDMLSNAKDMMSSLVSNSYLGPSIIQTMYIVLGTSTDVQVWMMNEERDSNGDINIISHKTMIGKHEDPIRCVCAPPLTLHKTLVHEGFLRNTLHYAIAGSEHHGVSIFTWSVLPHPTYTRELTPLASRDLDAFITIHTRYGKHSRAVEGEEVIKDIRDMTLEEKQQAVIRMATELDAEDGIIDETHQFDVTTYEHIDEIDDEDDTTKAKSRGITNLAISLGSQEKVNREESSQPSAASIGVSHLPPKTVDDILLPPTSEPPQPPRKRPATRSTPQVYSSSTNNIMASQTLIPDPNKKRSRVGASNLTQFNALAANHRTRPRNERSCTTDGDCVVS